MKIHRKLLRKLTIFCVLIAITIYLQGCGAKISYHPPIVPVEISIDTNGNITVEANGSISTPIGTFEAGIYANPSEYFNTEATLTVRLNGRDIIYPLEGTDFNISFSSGYYKQINLIKNNNNILLELRKIHMVNGIPTSFNINIRNNLLLPIEIHINGVFQGIVESDHSEIFGTDEEPYNVKWILKKNTTDAGVPLGDDMSGFFEQIDHDSKLEIDNVLADEIYYYAVVNNKLDVPCDIITNYKYNEQNNIGFIKPNRTNTGIGYFSANKTLNIAFKCEGYQEILFYGILPDGSGKSFIPYIRPDDGLILLKTN